MSDDKLRSDSKLDARSSTLPPAYDASQVEDAIYAEWERSGFFNPDTLDGDPFSVMMPPPNRTGTLHIGHAMGLAVQDLMTRFERMRGKKALWIPGTDHAAIATQVKVEQQLIKSGIKDPRRELGREKFLDEVIKFADASAKTINNQIRKMGSSCDWSREAYTLDEPRSRAVNRMFKMMFEDGIIERGDRLVNWDPQFQTTLSDDEVDTKEVKAKLLTFKYDADFPIAISTTRPETKFGDTAVAVHPDDERYKKFVGKTFTPTFCGKTITVKIIADEAVDPAFGTGALGVTPAHSMTDEEIAARHNLPMVAVIGRDGKMTDEAGKDFAGKTVKEARREIEKRLQENGLLVSAEEITQNLPIAQRGGAPVEQLPMKQWFVRVNKKFTLRQPTLGKWKAGSRVTLKQLMMEAVKSKQVKIIPPQFEKVYFHWIENLRDWCISRQIWFGHRVPVWYHEPKCVPRKGHESDVAQCIETVVSATKPACEFCDATYVQDPDTLDTWFSSGLWTFSTLGWPTTNVVFVRHGEVRSNTEAFLDSGTLGEKNDLTKLGVKQIKAAAKALKKLGVTRIVASSVYRAKRSAEILADALGVPVETDDRLRELGTGGRDGMSVEEFEKIRGASAGWRRGHAPMSGIETHAEVCDRMRAAVADIVKSHAGETIVVVSHGDPLAALFESYGVTDAWGTAYPTQGGIRSLVLDADGLPSNDLSTFHPTSVLETGRDILFFWIARMILMSTYALGEVPFHDAYLHGLVLDEQGRKMSKSLENIIDPLDMIKKYGTDAIRLSLLIGTTPGQDVKLSEEKIAGYRNFTNKLWNISRFILMQIGTDVGAHGMRPPADDDGQTDPRGGRTPSAPTLADRWILSRLSDTVSSVTKKLSSYQFSSAGEELRDFTWNDLADWYLEIAKVEGGKSKILTEILQTLLPLWHPFMPFVTEHLWKLAGFDGALIVAEWPTVTRTTDHGQRIKNFEKLKQWVLEARRLGQEPAIESTFATLIADHRTWINKMLRLKSVQPPPGNIAMERKEMTDYIHSLEIRLADKAFVSKAPTLIVNGLRTKLEAAHKKLQALDERVKNAS